jgi:hypothetical protein
MVMEVPMEVAIRVKKIINRKAIRANERAELNV